MKLHNTLTNSVEEFIPQNHDSVTLYTCGPTVYSEPLIGNWVSYIRWDLLVRTLRTNGYAVNRVMNITDVGHLTSDADDGEDKMEKGARREGVTAWEVAERYTGLFLEGMTQLNLLSPETLSKATEHIQEQIGLISQLETKGHVYTISDGVYFDTATFPSYADFAHLDLTAMKAGARIEFNTEKRNPSDFALWKFSPHVQRRDMEWDSPWGRGFPGWHIECSAMAIKYLGETIDIHTGGIDHIPVHHTNEIAQSEAATGKRFANYWLHSNFLLSNGTKISKSLGNGYTLGDLIEMGFSPLDFRMFVLQSHYRSESNFTQENLTAAANRYSHWKEVAALRHQIHPSSNRPLDEAINSKLLAVRGATLECLSDDLNSPLALTHIDNLFSAIDASDTGNIDATALIETLQYFDNLLGLKLLQSTPDIDDSLKQLIIERERARESRDWDLADKHRREIADKNIGLRDTPYGTRWYYL
ncbi:cysteine--tRNA ligase [Patescibacteria group bacterium]|nr:MAG: cysteine--tRNA ligase [Patescibacteria group bacterium]